MSTLTRTIELPDQGFVIASVLTGTKATVTYSEIRRDITLALGSSSGPRVRVPLSPESWALIIPELVAALPADLRDDVANAICAMAGEIAS